MEHMNYLEKELKELIKSDPDIIDHLQEDVLSGLWYWDLEQTGQEWMSPKFWATLGYTPDEMSRNTSSWREHIHTDDLIICTANLDKHLADPEHAFAQVVRFTHKNGSNVWLRMQGRAVRNAAGKAVRMFGAFVNFTQEKENEENNRILLDSIDEGFCIVEMIFDEVQKPVDFRFIMINNAFERQTGMQDAVGKRMREFAPDHEEHWFQTLGKVALTGEAERYENRAEQLHRWYDIYAFPYDDHKDYHVAILFNDITARKEAEEQVRSLNLELAQNLGEVEAANNELEAFCYTVSHDLRAPLRAINGYGKILEEDFASNLPEEAKGYIDSIRKNSHKMGNLIDDLLAFSRLGRKDVDRERVNTATMVNNIVSDFANHHNLKKESVHIGELHPAFGDNALLKQVWVNLISNAHKYSQNREEPFIEIGSTKEGEEITYHVKDNGVGFDMAYYNKLFGVFQRLHSEHEFEGTGIGLAIVERIVSRHGGRVWAESRKDEGACFYFTIPVLT
jgi:PAS domain S-box-containing protein